MQNKALPIVSVVIPMFNVGKYIQQCLDSVLSQSFRNFEVLCVDDGCTDDTLNIVNQYTDPRIKLIQQRNRGLSGARNTGIFAAKGLYVALLDADDFWAPDKLKLHVKHLNENPHIDVSYSPSVFVNEAGEPLGIGQFPRLQNISFKHVVCRNPVGNGSAPVIRRYALLGHKKLSETVGRKEIFNESLKQSEDIEMWVRMAEQKDNSFEGIPQPLTFYRVNNSGLSANMDKQYNAWFRAISALKSKSTKISNSMFSLAQAYQYRYLARRAIQSGDASKALKLIHKALFCNPRILFEETGRTLVTYCCAFLVIAPRGFYQQLENVAMRLTAANAKRY